MRLIDADELERNGWSMGRSYRADKDTITCEYKKPSDFPTIEPEQQWIPCNKQEYPNDNREVEVTCEFTRYDGKKYRYTCHASYVHKYSIESTDYCNWEECDEYNEEEDKYYALPGWYERVHNWDDYSYCAIEDRVVAWRELSEPWKGEEDDSISN